MKVCICQICTCGRHHCPHNRPSVVHKGDQPCALTEYANKYTSKQIPMRESCKPLAEPYRADAPLDDKTTNRVDYIKHPLMKPHVHQSDVYKKPDGDFDMNTNYKNDYTRKPIERSKPMKPEYTKKSAGKFEGVPTYTNDYRKWPMNAPERVGRSDGYRAPDAPFEGSSNYTTDYIRHSMNPTLSMKPAETARQSDQPFSDDTGYRRDYIRHPMPPKHQKEKPTWKSATAPLDGLSNYMKDYIPKQMEKMPSCKPDAAAYQSDQPFHDDTTHKIDYRQWPASKPYAHQPDQYIKPDGDFDFKTTHKRDFTPKEMERRMAKRPPSRQKVTGKFNDDTNYKDDFRKWPMGARPQMTMRSGYNPPEAPFEGTSNYHDDYIGHGRFMPPTSLKPAETARNSDLPFDSTTGYRQDYIKHPLAPKEMKEKPVYKANSAPMDGLSNYMRDYIAKQGEKMPSCKPDAAAYQSDQPFHDSTTHKVDYKKWPASKPYAHQPDQYQKPDGDFDFGTTHNRDFTPKPMQRLSAKRPPSRQKIPGKFDGTTNYTEDFRKWPMGGRQMLMKKTDYRSPDAPFEGSSNYQDDYIGHGLAMPPASMKPADKGFSSNAPFEDNTMYRTEYTPKKADICPAIPVISGRGQFVFKEKDSVGHQWYEPMTSITPLRSGSATNGIRSSPQVALSVA